MPGSRRQGGIEGSCDRRLSWWRSGASFLYIIPVVALCLTTSSPSLALGQQQGVQEVRQVVGPHDIRAQTITSTLSTGKVRLIITVLEANSGRPVGNAMVRIWTTRQSTGARGWALALNGPAVPERYEATVRLDSPGVWLLEVEINDSLGDSLLKLLSVEVPALKRYTAGSLVFVAITLVVVLGGGYVWWRIRQEQQKRGVTPGGV